MLHLNGESCRTVFDSIRGELTGAGVDWLDAARRRAIEEVAERGFPTVRHEDWKYTDLRALTRREYAPLPVGTDDVAIPQVDGLDGPRLVLVNGHCRKDLSRFDGLDEGVELTALAARLVEAGDVRRLLGSAMPDERHGFSALNAAFLNDGAYLRIGAGVRVDKPIEIVSVATGGDADVLLQPRNLLILEDGAEAQVILRFVGEASAEYLTNVVSECLLGERSRLNLSVIQEEGARGGHIGGLYIRQCAASEAVVNTVTLGGMLVRNDLRIALDEPGATCHANGLVLGDGRQHVDNHTQIEHNVPRCTSRELYKAILDDRARAVFHGRIVVREGAQQTDSEQQSLNLLLSRDAEIDTKPQLEIYADDVKCSHGATVGQLDEASVFYLRSRGIDEASARALLTFAFAIAAIESIADPALRAHVDATINRKLGTAM